MQTENRTVKGYHSHEITGKQHLSEKPFGGDKKTNSRKIKVWNVNILDTTYPLCERPVPLNNDRGHKYNQLGQFTMMSQPSGLFWIDWLTCLIFV